MSASYYDVVVVGLEPAGLFCAALLSKRGFRVLVLGHESVAPSYVVDGLTLPRGPFTFDAAHSPVARRVLSELASNQDFRRRATTADPVLQLATPGHRIDLACEPQDLERELEREAPLQRRAAEQARRTALMLAERVDRLIERDLVWPPETFFERREHARAGTQQPFDREGAGPDLLAELPEASPARLLVRCPVAFSTASDPSAMTAFQVARLYAAWLREPATLDGGLATLHALLVERIVSQGGDVRPSERVQAVVTKRGQACGVRLERTGEDVGCAFVVASCGIGRLLRLVPDRRPFEEIFERLGEPQARLYRFVTNILVAAEGVPEAMARDLFVVRDPRRPLSGENALRVEASGTDAEGRRLLSVETLLPRRAVEEGPGTLDRMRERVVESLGTVLPFLDRHVLLIDSPHDGRDARDVRANGWIACPEPWTRGPSTMRAVSSYPVTSTYGVCALPVRTPVRRLLLASEENVPGLGQEGELLAAWSAARVISRADRRKDRLRRGLWSRAEL